MFNKYNFRAGCENCGQYYTMKVPKGVRTKDWIDRKEARCPNCDCLILPQQESEDEE